MLSALTSHVASSALAVIIVVSPPGDDQPGGTVSSRAPEVPAAGASTATGTPTPSWPAASSDSDGPDMAPLPCTARVRDAAGLEQALSSAGGGSHVCVDGTLGSRLTISKGGSARRPLLVSGGGRAVVKGITVEADNVVVDGFQVLGAMAPGIELTGDGITASNNLVRHPTGGDFDGLRFFGDDLRIVHNTITDISPDDSGAHADCMQTFTSGRPASERVVIDANLCDNIDNQCLMAEGPGDVGDGGGGGGRSGDWLLSNNYCEYGAGQAYMIEAVQDVTIRNNEFVGSGDKAIGLDIGATGAKVSANRLVGITAAVGISEDSRGGYQGPEPQGGP